MPLIQIQVGIVFVDLAMGCYKRDSSSELEKYCTRARANIKEKNQSGWAVEIICAGARK